MQGCEQLGGKLVNTRKWIGATEIVAFFTANLIKTEMLDFHMPTKADGTHPKLFQWVLEYFRERARAKAFIPPLYLQHQGHSRTIVGKVNSKARRSAKRAGQQSAPVIKARRSA